MAKNSSTDDWAKRFETLLGHREEVAPPVYDDSVDDLELLTPAEMADADRRAVATGIRSYYLMERAGEAVAAVAGRMADAGSPIAILVGPGNNGGDGFVAARLLAEGGYRVSVHLLGSRELLKGDASLAARAWKGPVEPARRDFADGARLIIDALFGAGLDRPVTGTAAEVIDGANESGIPILSVDLPSGLDGESGVILGRAMLARETVTFFRKKPGHLLLPGRIIAGRTTLADIGHDPIILNGIKPSIYRNGPLLWRDALPVPRIDGHKYDRGHALVVSGPVTGTGAARLAARGALRVGAGLVTVASPPDAVAANAAHLTAIMLKPFEGADGLAQILADTRKNAVVLGPALGIDGEAGTLVATALASPAAVVVDADGLTAHAYDPDALFAQIKERSSPVVLTPHDGEFARLFPDLVAVPSKLDRTRQAADRSGAIVVLKGADTVVAAPDGFAAIADNAPADLATAGAGDVLGGLIGGLLAQRMEPFGAAAAGVWMHGEAASRFGRGLIAEDLPETIPTVLTDLLG